MPMGNEIRSENITVYYKDVSKQEAVKFTKFWKQNEFVGSKDQVIQLLKLEDGNVGVKLIEKSIYHEEPLTIKEQALLQELEYRLEREVFGGETTIIITDNTLRPIERE